MTAQIRTEERPGAVFQIHPIQDPRWADLVSRHPRASIFHTVSWLQTLQRTYGFEPIALTTSPPGAGLTDGLVLCRVNSWLTGRRLVSLPFSDHCEPLLATAADESPLLSALVRLPREEKLRYLEVRATHPLTAPADLHFSTQTYCFHHLDLQPDLASLFANCHKSSTQRKILRAERDGLTCETGRSPALLETFLDLFLITRRKHGVPPQPKAWFYNLIDCFGEALNIRVALKDRQPVAAILTIRHKDTLVYKYGCSDARFNNMGGTQLLFWRAIQQAKRDGLLVFDLGRSDFENPGLITFKDRWGSTRSALTYTRFSVSASSGAFHHGDPAWSRRIMRRIVPCLPVGVLKMVGSVLYKHIA